MKNILITGGTGLVGSGISRLLSKKDYTLKYLTRKKLVIPGIKTYVWDITNGFIEKEALKNVDYIIHLAGANIGQGRWTKKRKQEIYDSRIKSTQLLYKYIQQSDHKIQAIISSSAVGYYGMRTSNKILTENDLPGSDFLGNVCKDWESAVDQFGQLGIRTVKLRTGIVMSANGGILPVLIRVIKMYLGAPLSAHEFYMPWIHINDLSDIYLWALENNSVSGAFNAVAPHYVTHQQCIKIIAEKFKRPILFPSVPENILRLLFGEKTDMLIHGSRISAEKLNFSGYQFKYKNLESALKNIILETE
ncbi:MAG: TIGR01777 family oxidoreductase [Bacteroidales bacterium]|nr:TIGR01777 family oxidoreductase [Bacteroidales bacterium]